MMNGPRILLIVGGGIAAYKSCELVRLVRKGFGDVAGDVTCVLTEGGSKFVTPMTLAALSENPVHTTLWDLNNEVEMGHIQLSRAADLIVVCPATADLMAKMAAGIADDLATTLLLATDKPVMAVPAMNVRMWQHEATVRNVAALRDAGVFVMEPNEGAMACGEFGPGRLPEPAAIWAQIAELFEIPAGEPEFAFPPEPFPEPEINAVDDSVFDDDSDPQASEPGGSDPEPGFDLGGLLSSMIPRSFRKAPMILADPDDEIEPGEHDPGEDYDPASDPYAVDTSAPLPDIDLANSPLLSKKGSAAPAPPTDPSAINEPRGDFAPDPVIEGEAGTDTLAGQPDFASDVHRPLYGRHVLITAGPTHEPIDPVRFIANRSSGRQGFAIAAAAARAGARVTLISGPVALPTPPGVDRVDVETAREMAAAVDVFLPADVGIFVAAVADWRSADFSGEKLKKRQSAPPSLRLTENPDILATIASSAKRPGLLIGFAAETEDVLENAKEKRKRKGTDWIVANDVSAPGGKGEWSDKGEKRRKGERGVMGGASNTVHIITAKGVESLDPMPKEDVGEALVERIIHALDA